MSSLKLEPIDKGILSALQGDLSGSPEPYELIGRELNVSEEEVILRINRMVDSGIIRRIGAMIRHIEAGINFNGMVVWKVSPDRVEEIGQIFANVPQVTHCYERPPFGAMGGNLFTMIHSSSKDECMETVARMAKEVGLEEYEILFSERELKKVSMTYFDD
ncbi:MAG: AsnC family transcriptional regulator [Desulfomonile sp.]|jgi:DNA-binding Lrp family transcriptional regulator